LPIRTLRQTSRKPCSIAYARRKINTTARFFGTLICLPLQHAGLRLHISCPQILHLRRSRPGDDFISQSTTQHAPNTIHRISPHRRRLDRLRHHREVVQTLFHEQSDDPVRVEQKVRPRRGLVPDDRVERFELRGLWEGEDRRRQGRGSLLGGWGRDGGHNRRV
jgi:hypothetical protein